jgi:hypothetical protein
MPQPTHYKIEGKETGWQELSDFVQTVTIELRNVCEPADMVARGFACVSRLAKESWSPESPGALRAIMAMFKW